MWGDLKGQGLLSGTVQTNFEYDTKKDGTVDYDTITYRKGSRLIVYHRQDGEIFPGERGYNDWKKKMEQDNKPVNTDIWIKTIL